ncbi:helix-turn-helix domain-containing protein [Epilithonimonas arachidiradicis]|uniref:AraC-like DNA-binding protein n=2 Tax=Epilithonimonas arachidiradicis TaxID=1617282 RepID=A0A420D7P1_9FLAO|nr:AraC family transcriptional regulator [Epilithonimonas arachidiradicis]RKE86776.1 AraC-like DNA-binding protein [Epilithonimonas arachidiradicis]
MKNFFSIIILFVSTFVLSKDKTGMTYESYRKGYESFSENDNRAFAFLDPYIKKAKKEKKQEELFQAYRDAAYYSKSWNKKLLYADSCLDAAYKTSSDDKIATAYILKGSIYYAKMKKYKPALDEYLMAYKYSKNTGDPYLTNKVSYHLGVVKNYLGYNEEALALFKECVNYFETEANNTKSHKYKIFNNQKGYLNSLHQMIICYRNIKDFAKADSLINIGLLKTFNNNDFSRERSYFLKSKGLSEYSNGKYNSAIDYLTESLQLMKDDFAWESVDYFYIGKSYLALKNENLAILNFKKIDSIFTKQEFILPELRENYEILINHYKDKNDPKQQLFYTTQLLKADSIISRDFAYLSPKVHREYDTNALLEEKGKLEKANIWSAVFISVLTALAVFLIFTLYKKFKKEKDILQKYFLIQEKLQNHNYVRPETITPITHSETNDDKKTHIAEAIKEELLHKLKVFEEKKHFIQKGLTIQKLAIQLDTNSNYLSHVINEYKGMNFNKYLGDLRIRYITRLLFEKNIYLNYTIDTLAKECGIASRQNFSDLFFEINGIRPTDFIRKRKKEIENNLNYPTLESMNGLVSEN